MASLNLLRLDKILYIILLYQRYTQSVLFIISIVIFVIIIKEKLSYHLYFIFYMKHTKKRYTALLADDTKLVCVLFDVNPFREFIYDT